MCVGLLTADDVIIVLGTWCLKDAHGWMAVMINANFPSNGIQ